MSGVTDRAIADRTDVYFNRTRSIVEKFGDARVTYAVFLRRPVISAPRIAVDWLRAVAAERDTAFDIELVHEEGEWVGAGDPLLYLTGSFAKLADLETLYLQKLGAACVAAHNAYQMSLELPQSAFLAMDARHCAGAEMQDMMAYAASVGSARVLRASWATPPMARRIGLARMPGAAPCRMRLSAMPAAPCARQKCSMRPSPMRG